MRFNAFFILTLLFIVIAAPVVDATICSDCNDATTLTDISQRPVSSSTLQLIPDHAGSDSQTTTARDLCPICSLSAAAIDMAFCGKPSTIGHVNHPPELLSQPNLSFSIIKPPKS